MSDFRLLIDPDGEGGFIGTSPDVHGMVATRATSAEVVEIAEDFAIELQRITSGQ